MDTEIVIVIVIVAVIVAVETSGLLKMFSFFLSIQTTDLTATLREYIGLDLKVLLLLRFTIARPKRRGSSTYASLKCAIELLIEMYAASTF